MSIRTLLVGVLLLSCAMNAQAQPGCQLSLGEAVVDFGLMNRAASPASAPERPLGQRRINLNLNCEQPSDMTLFYRGVAASMERYRFDRGTYRLQAQQGVLDGRAVELGLVKGPGQPPLASATQLHWRPDHAIVPLRHGEPLNGQQFSVQLELSAWAPGDATQVRDATTWQTSGIIDAHSVGLAHELTLRAHFAPAACTPTLSNGGVVDLGKLAAKDLHPERNTPLPPKPLLLTVGCDAPTHFALRMQDNRQGSATGAVDESAYGLDMDARQQKIGRYHLSLNPADVSVDSLAQVYRTDSSTAGQAWSSASAQPIALGTQRYLGFTDSPGSRSGPVAIQHLSAPLHLNAFIAPLQDLDLRSEVLLNGSGTLEVIYL